ncbi:MAG: 5-formyltetrahydrofolate cyclo-ligase [Schwartzia sp.]|nr:5-formyltetrahydrofolate cyclo-ligase [Schwartzia sp. (in: firmicutes)]
MTRMKSGMPERVDFDGEKRALRKKMLVVRRALSPTDRRTFSEIIGERLVSHENVDKAQFVFAYVGMEDEVQTETLLSRLLDMGKQVAIPWITGKRAMEAVLVPSMDALEAGTYHILTVREEIREVLPPQAIDCVIVPGVAFGRDGTRLGMGGGYYDAFLPKAAKAVKIAAAFQCQIADHIPSLPHDCGVDWIATEQGVFKTSKK